jgi:phage portal protein BeeE
VGLLERVNSRAPALRDKGKGLARRDAGLSLDQWALAAFGFNGSTYPFVQTTMGSVDREAIIGSAVGAHKGNPTIFSLVQARIQAFSQIRFQWTRFTGSQAGDLFGDQRLNLLEKPWPGGSTSKLLSRMELDNCLAGNAYIARVRPDRLSRLRPDYVQIILGSQTDADRPADAADVEIAGFAYFPRSSAARLFLPEEVAHYAPMPDPDFQFLGMSWIGACIRELQADSLASEHKARFFENAATPNMAIKFDPSIEFERVKQFKALLEQEHGGGVWDAYKTLYLGGGADVTVIGKDFQQLDFAITQGKGESRLAAASGVPPSWVGFSEALKGSSLNQGNFNSARRRFADGTMVHLWTEAANALDYIIGGPAGAQLWYDSRVPFMREDASDLASIQLQQSTTINALVMQGFEPDSVIKAVMANDWKMLVHTGMLSVQLQRPGEVAASPSPQTAITGKANTGVGGTGVGGTQ